MGRGTGRRRDKRGKRGKRSKWGTSAGEALAQGRKEWKASRRQCITGALAHATSGVRGEEGGERAEEARRTGAVAHVAAVPAGLLRNGGNRLRH